MQAVIYTEYGSPDVLHVAEVDKPTPQDNEILIKINATPVGFGDLLARRFNETTPRNFTMPGLFWLLARLDFGWNKPKKPILGSQFAGEVVATGSAVRGFKVGDQVFGYRGQQMGTYAEYLAMPEDGMVALKPANLSDEEASAMPYGALMAIEILKKGGIQPGQKVLINGASGSIGAAAVQIAKSYGAEVTGVCGAPRMAYVQALGADHVIDYRQEDFTTSGSTYDLILDVLGKSDYARVKPVLNPGGRYLLVSFKMKQVMQMLWTALTGSSKRVICTIAGESQANMQAIKDMAAAGTLKAIVDRQFPLDQTAEAHHYAESGQKQGSVVITLA
jgi:NADPH:quinone reductase-like Zn-dependent oxidoreductase